MMEAVGLMKGPHRIFPLVFRVSADALRSQFEQRTLYSYSNTIRPTEGALRLVIDWILRAQRSDGGIPAYYSLMRGYSESYPEVTGYIVPTLYDYAHLEGDTSAAQAAERAANWLMSLRMGSGAFPAGLHMGDEHPSVFNSGQILQGLVRAYLETQRADVLEAASATGDWLASVQSEDGSWGGVGAYQGAAHTYYSMVAWALALLAQESKAVRHRAAAERNLDWVLGQIEPSGWTSGINLKGYPTFLHFIAYVIQGVLESGIALQRKDGIEAASRSARVLLRKFEVHKALLGAYDRDFKSGMGFVCLTGNAQMACVWLRLHEVTGELRYLNGALKINELLKEALQTRGNRGALGGVAGSYPIWGPYQPLRYISWGCKFLADALMLELRLKRAFEARACAS
jgi:hypothetical protein